MITVTEKIKITINDVESEISVTEAKELLETLKKMLGESIQYVPYPYPVPAKPIYPLYPNYPNYIVSWQPAYIGDCRTITLGTTAT